MAAGSLKQYILVVDDDPAHLLMICRTVRQIPGLEILSAASIAEARNILIGRDDPPQLLLIDLRLNNESGLDLLRWLRSQGSLSQVPAMMLSTSQNPKDSEASTAAGADYYLVKNSDLAEFKKDLIAAVSGLLKL